MIFYRDIDVPFDKIREYMEDLAFSNYTSIEIFEKYANGSKTEYLRSEEYLGALLEVVFTTNKEGTIFPMKNERPFVPIITEMGICSTVNPFAGIYYSPK